jgi:phosphotransferase system HPr (HPr) family protein
MMPQFSPSQPEIRRVTRKLTLSNEHGLHARPATELVRCAAAFASTITIASNGKSYRADRIMEVLLADLNRGDTFMIEAVGPDAIQAVERIGQLVASLKELEEKARQSKNPNREMLD